jgi:hypothetical protein
MLKKPLKDPFNEEVGYDCLVMLCVGLIVGMFLVDNIKKPVIINTAQCFTCHYKLAMKQYFKKVGSKQPERMANAIIQTKQPRLYAAISVVESGGNPSIHKSGYKKRHYGAFQVNPKHWGRVSQDPVEQALQAENILQELVQEKGSLKRALSAYGGDSTNKYQRRVLAELVRVP